MSDISLRTQKKVLPLRRKTTQVSWLISTVCYIWDAILDSKTCPQCKTLHGQVVGWLLSPLSSSALNPPLHLHCRCSIMHAPLIFAGTAACSNSNEAHWKITGHDMLPQHGTVDIIQRMLESIPWQKNLISVAIGRSRDGDQYAKLIKETSSKSGRIWYEADLKDNKNIGGPERLLYSNDGVILAMFDTIKTVLVVVVDNKVRALA
ncbi:MAG: minor capsid protein [Armatimonadota bacterium]